MARSGRLAHPEAAQAVLADGGAPLTSAGGPGPAVPAAAGVLAVVRTPAPDALADPDSALARSGARDVLLTARGAVALADGQRVTVGEAGAAETFVVRGRVELRARTFDGWAVVPLAAEAP